MSDAAYAARLAAANAHIDEFINNRGPAAQGLLSMADRLKKEEAAKALVALADAPRVDAEERPGTPDLEVVKGAEGMNTLRPNSGGRRKSKRRKSKRTSKSKKSRR